MQKGVLFSAFALNDDQKQRIEQRFSQISDEAVSLDLEIQPDLLCGIRVELGGRVYDGSYKTRLTEVLRTLKYSAEEAENHV